MKAGLAPGASEKLADLELKLVDLDEKIIKELLQPVPDSLTGD